MSKYIDAEKLKYEIERRNLSNYYTTTEGYEEELYEIIDSLQQEQPEVELEKEIANYFCGLWPGIKTQEARNHDHIFTTSAIMELAKHFYELGLNARKEE